MCPTYCNSHCMNTTQTNAAIHVESRILPLDDTFSKAAESSNLEKKLKLKISSSKLTLITRQQTTDTLTTKTTTFIPLVTTLGSTTEPLLSTANSVFSTEIDSISLNSSSHFSAASLPSISISSTASYPEILEETTKNPSNIKKYFSLC